MFLSRQESRFLEVQRPGQVVRVQLFRAGSNASLLPGPHQSPAPIDLRAILVIDGGEILGWDEHPDVEIENVKQSVTSVKSVSNDAVGSFVIRSQVSRNTVMSPDNTMLETAREHTEPRAIGETAWFDSSEAGTDNDRTSTGGHTSNINHLAKQGMETRGELNWALSKLLGPTWPQ